MEAPSNTAIQKSLAVRFDVATSQDGEHAYFSVSRGFSAARAGQAQPVRTNGSDRPTGCRDFSCHKGRFYGFLYSLGMSFIGIPQVSIVSNNDKYFGLIFKFSQYITPA